MVLQREGSDEARHEASAGEQDPLSTQRKNLFMPFYGGELDFRAARSVVQAWSPAGSEEAWVRLRGSVGLDTETQQLNGCCRLAQPALNLEQPARLRRGVPGGAAP